MTFQAEAFDEAVRETADREQLPSLVAAVVADGQLVHEVGVGHLSTTPPTSGTVYRIASMTKAFTAACVLMLRDDALLGLDDPIASHVPALAAVVPPTADSPCITVRHLLTMASGMATDDAWADRHLADDEATMDALFGAGATFARPPGLTMTYSNFGYAMLGRIVSVVSGQPFSRFVDERLLQPLGLHSTSFTRPPASDVAEPFRLVDGEVTTDEPPPLGDGGFGAMGGLWSTAADLARWVAFLAEAYPPRDDADAGPLRRASRRELQSVHTPYSSPKLSFAADGSLRQIPLGYGMGVQRFHHLSLGDVVTHSGGLPGYGSNMRWLPHRGVGVVALANLTYAPMAQLTDRLLDVLHESAVIPEPPPLPVDETLTAAVHDLARLFRSWHDDRAAATFADNVHLDDPWARRRADALEILGSAHDLIIVKIDALSATEADVAMHTGGGNFTVSIELAPTVPPRIQRYEIRRDDDA